ncbi:zonular occludens toxin domain-containing protein [Acinetobacter pittii]|uniref:zonular occludens toxin domain-containing protein n=1 Tax=Acinetobacter pittii TaxID=48296 RepID=UPI00070F5570|nr:zonular occludens toxin domain-containing protein [Acinetobacter pittii]MDC4922503.1 zonular occludens toxin domain-containing protein [Acinetobacter baumannii]KRI82108.1 Zonular occludens toxin [Acinetobacter pittii]KRJ63796.1 Zonular occludens toxin [Acinetobacter pittii]MBJ9719890.1 Zonular occludens toxin [Acinetobacter pittii]MBJ9778561.1 Zonular occludens toxin [Acinetobacter pittii]
MAIKLITAQPGSYKTAMMMELANKMSSEGRPIYLCNVRGLKPAIPFPYQVLDHFKDWVDTPETSVIFIDEVQEFTRDVPTNCKTEDLPTWMTLLEKHRHEGKDIFIVTQHPMFIHTHVRRLTSEHIHLVRNGNVPFAAKRSWGFVESDPDDFQKATFKNGCTTSIYKPNKEVFEWYESTVLDTHKFKFPTKLIKGVAIVAGLIGFAVWFGYPVASKYFNMSDKEVTAKASDQSQTTLAEQAERDAYLAGLTPEQYADLKNPEKRNAELQAKNDVRMETIAVKYNPNRPYEIDTSQIQYEVTAKPVFSGCMKQKGRYVAYTQQGTILHDVSQSDCIKLMEDGDRPFNYFAQEQQPQQQQKQQFQQADSDFMTTQRERELIAKYEAAKLQGLI